MLSSVPCVRLARLARRHHAIALAAVALISLAAAASAQTGIRAHYAHGQVWVVWTSAAPHPETYAVFASDQPITDLADADPVGRLFAYEYFPGALRDQFGPADRGWAIPAPGGGTETLAGDQALFVETVHASGPRHYAVVAWGETGVTPGVNATITPAAAVFSPQEPVTCHQQLQTSTAPGFLTRAFVMWADGRDDPGAGRPDFPVMANAAKNGMPSLFLISFREGIGPGPHPVAYWLHGGQGRAAQSTPGSRAMYGIDPQDGLLVAHNDDLVRWVERDGEPVIATEPGSSWWFGWPAPYDPFTLPAATPPAGAVVIDYTQRRLLWIHGWLVQRGSVDPARTSILGHSMGSAGATALAKAHPGVFGSCTIFNNGGEGPSADVIGQTLLGRPQDALATNLTGPGGGPVPVPALFDLVTPIHGSGTLPFFRVFHGKNDTNPTMEWDAEVVAQYAAADSLGYGMHLYWDERPHGPSPEHPGHWAAGEGQDLQTERDNVHYQERYRADRSFPAFFDHRVQAGARDPGAGDPDSGDPWGTWGGYHDWEPGSVVDEPGWWEATIFLTGLSDWPVDNCPLDSLVCDLTVGRPRQFQPDPGELVAFEQVDLGTGAVLRTGQVIATPRGRVRVPDVVTYRDPRRTQIRLWRPALTGLGGAQVPAPPAALTVAPNPFNPRTTVRFAVPRPGPVRLTVHDVRGRRLATLVQGRRAAGEHAVRWDGRDERRRPVASGTYLIRLQAPGAEAASALTLVR